MSTISLSDLKRQPAEFIESVGKDDVVITSNGNPVAVLMGVGAGSVESTQALVRSVRALQAQSALQQSALKDGVSELSSAQIDSEIAEARGVLRKK